MELMDALGLTGKEMVCFMGAGGKSSLMQKLAPEHVRNGRRVLVTTSARMFARQLRELGELILEPDCHKLLRELESSLLENDLLAAGSGLTDNDKVTGLSKDCLDFLFSRNLFDSILVEADGSRGKSFKAPAEHEPVLPPSCTTVIPVVGIDILGRPLTEEFVHRHDLVSQIARQDIGSEVTGETVLKVIRYYRVLAEKVSGSISIVPVINKADSEDMAGLAKELAFRMFSGNIRRVLVTSAVRPDPVREVVVA